MMLYTVAIVLVHAVLAVQAGDPSVKIHPAIDANALCADKPVAPLTMVDLEDLFSLVASSKCSIHAKGAIQDMLILVAETQDNVCAQKSIDKLHEYYAKYLDNKEEQLPKAFKKFALDYEAKIKSQC